MSKIKCLYTNLDYLTIAIETKKPSGILKIESYDHSSTSPIVKRNEKVLNEDKVLKILENQFNFKEEDKKKFKDPTNRFQDCLFYSTKNGVNLKRFSEKIPLELKGQFFLKQKGFYKLKPVLKNLLDNGNKIKCSRIDITKDFQVQNGIEDIISKKSFIRKNFLLPKDKKIQCYYNNGVLESLTFGWSSLKVSFYRKDIQIENIKDETKKKRLKQLYKNKKVVRVEISFQNSSKKCESLLTKLIYSRLKTENIINDVFKDIMKKHYLYNLKNKEIVKEYSAFINHL